jgi:hypothetical protein
MFTLVEHDQNAVYDQSIKFNKVLPGISRQRLDSLTFPMPLGIVRNTLESHQPRRFNSDCGRFTNTAKTGTAQFAFVSQLGFLF